MESLQEVVGKVGTVEVKYAASQKWRGIFFMAVSEEMTERGRQFSFSICQ